MRCSLLVLFRQLGLSRTCIRTVHHVGEVPILRGRILPLPPAVSTNDVAPLSADLEDLDGFDLRRENLLDHFSTIAEKRCAIHLC